MNQLLFGAAYYPEHDPESEWPLDAALMRDAGFNIIRVGEFCWNRMQSPDGKFTLDWLQRLVELYDQQGIKTVLCTPTATPPVWVVDKFPDLAPVLPDGRKGLFGGRRHYSAFHKGYRDLSVDIARGLAERFGKHPAVAGWHIDNEIGSYSTVDCSEPALKAFRQHVERKFGTIEALNKAWGLIFWNQEIQYFDQLPAPTQMMCTRNPQYVHEYNRFCLRGMADFALAQAEVIRPQIDPHQWVVASCEGMCQQAIFDLQRERGVQFLDYVELNNYPELLPQHGQPSMRMDIVRATDRPRRCMVLEQQTGSGYTTTGGLDPAVRRFWAWDALARGSLSLCWFHWRRFRTGCEWRHTGVVERDRKPRSVYKSIQSTIREARGVESILLSAKVVPDVQVYMDIDSILAWDRSSEPIFWMEIQLPDAVQQRFPMWEKEVRRAVYNPLSSFGLTLDFVKPHETPDPSRPLIIPELDLCTPERADGIRRFVEAGGTCICFPGVGERDEFAAQREMPSPGLLGPVFGIELADYYPLSAGQGAIYDPALGKMTSEAWPEVDTTASVVIKQTSIKVDARHGEILAPKGAEVVGTYQGGPCHGQPAITLHRPGRGLAFYLGAVPATPEAATSLYRILLPQLTAKTVPYRRMKLESDKGRFTFLFNDRPAGLPLEAPIQDLITGTRLPGLPPWGVALVKA